jgi:hypothetical protein
LRCSQASASGPFPELDESIPHTSSSFFKIYFILIFPTIPGLRSGLLPSCFQTKILYAFLFSATLVVCPNLLILIIFDEDYRFEAHDCAIFLQTHVSSFLLGPGIFLRTLFSDIVTLCCRTQLPVQWVRCFSWVKRQRREAGHSSPPSAEVKEHFVA